MNELPRQKLQALIAEHGRRLYENPRRCEALLRDYCGVHKREIHVLMSALKEQVVGTLLTQAHTPYEVIQARLTKRLCDNLALSEDAAKWAVESWAIALGVIKSAKNHADMPVLGSGKSLTDAQCETETNMSARRLLAHLREKDVQLKSSGTGRLVVDAPKTALTPELRNSLSLYKAEILKLLEEEEPTERHSRESLRNLTVKATQSLPEHVEPEPNPSLSAPSIPLATRDHSAHTAAPRAELPVAVDDEEDRRLHNDARRFARLLVSEIKLYNHEKIAEGRSKKSLYQILQEDIDRSRTMYDKRVKPAVVAKRDYFHEELVDILAEGDESKLGEAYPGPTIRPLG